jgi:hypothetical protein
VVAIQERSGTSFTSTPLDQRFLLFDTQFLAARIKMPYEHTNGGIKQNGRVFAAELVYEGVRPGCIGLAKNVAGRSDQDVVGARVTVQEGLELPEPNVLLFSRFMRNAGFCPRFTRRNPDSVHCGFNLRSFRVAVNTARTPQSEHGRPGQKDN